MNDTRPIDRNRADIIKELYLCALEELQNGKPADQTLRHIFKVRKQYGSKDRRLYANAVFSAFRWLGWSRDRSAEQQLAIGALCDGLMSEPALQILFEEAFKTTSIPINDHASLSEKADLLGTLFQTPAPLIADVLPAWVIDQFHRVPSPRPVEALIESIQSRPPTWFRVPAEQHVTLENTLKNKGITYHCNPEFLGSFACDQSIPLQQLSEDTGIPVEIQDLASQCVIRFCTARPNQSWWDVCAGAGGKTLLLAEQIPGGNILATDRRPIVNRELSRRAKRMGIGQIQTRQWDARAVLPSRDRFDGVLVDAPCSGIGTWSRNPDARWRTAANEPQQKSKIQSQLLDASSDLVRAGGMLVYAVCTLTTTETVDVVSRFLDQHKDFDLSPVPHPLTKEPTRGDAWIWPWMGPCNAMYIARFQRKRK